MEFVDGQRAPETQYFADPLAPGPCPVLRSRLCSKKTVGNTDILSAASGSHLLDALLIPFIIQ